MTGHIDDAEQPDGIEDDSRDLPNPAPAADRVREFLSWHGDGRIYLDDRHPPLFARDLQALADNARRPDVVSDFVAERHDFTIALKNCRESIGDYYRWQGHVEARRQLSERLAAAAQTPAAIPTDPNYFRHCDWPGCLRAYDVRTGPNPKVDGEPWILIRSIRTLLCPTHHDTGHRPRHFEWKPGDTSIAMSCECGTRADGLTPTSQRRCMEWWSDHVLALRAPDHSCDEVDGPEWGAPNR
ncbi:hypothetical protein [Amycolatopsis sp. TNS106]|uniref:hypothetical protein n=1 Tax=Amycolatopsis sp. TNS106 TaxID=2861750 RepID=UPI001C568BAE|nr:hypothetical protein [Amycolatopsis sp. TNS106]QXV57424.1 hypothetical protein CVV72_10765 [Amycolatopsis sp. TNS106]